MNDVIRFDIYFRGGVPELIPRLDGRYMRFDDHEKATARIAELTEHMEIVRKSYDDCYAENEKLTAEVASLRELVSSAEGIFQNCDVVSGMCGCGDAMDRHSNHHYDHAPRDIAVSSVDSWLEQAHIARNALREVV